MAGGGASTEGGGSSPSPEAGATAAPTARDGEEGEEDAGISTSKDVMDIVVYPSKMAERLCPRR